jgi:hypothetical protein
LPAKRQKGSTHKLKPKKSASPLAERKQRKTKREPPSPSQRPIKLEPPSSPPRLSKKKTPLTKPAPVQPQHGTPIAAIPFPPPAQAEIHCPFPLLRLENPPGKNHCFFNATVQLLRLLPEARFFFHQAYLYLPAARDRLGWTHDLGALFAEEGTGRVGSVDPMRKAAYFPHAECAVREESCPGRAPQHDGPSGDARTATASGGGRTVNVLSDFLHLQQPSPRANQRTPPLTPIHLQRCRVAVQDIQGGRAPQHCAQEGMLNLWL